jgi:hypothetical protein
MNKPFFAGTVVETLLNSYPGKAANNVFHFNKKKIFKPESSSLKDGGCYLLSSSSILSILWQHSGHHLQLGAMVQL